MPDQRTLWGLVRPLVYVGWTVAVIRFAMEWFAPAATPYFGVYYVMPAVLIVLGIRSHFAGVRFWRFVLAMVTVAALVWVVPNCFTYTVGQFMGWTHGRFAPNVKSEAVADTTLGKIGTGLMVAGLTGVAGTLWMTAWGFFVAWLPSKLREEKS